MKPLLCASQVVRNFLNVQVNSWPARPVDPAKPFQFQDRRPVKPQPAGVKDGVITTAEGHGYIPFEQWGKSLKIGDVLYVREAFWRPKGLGVIEFLKPEQRGKDWEFVEGLKIIDADAHEKAFKKSPPTHMPEELSRIHLEVMRVRVERASDISEADSLAEGCEKNIHPIAGEMNSAKDRFEKLWCSLYGPEAWDKWVWCYDLKRTK